MNGEWIDIVAISRDDADRLAGGLSPSFDVEAVSDEEHVVRVTPDSETTARLVALFDAIGTWLTERGLEYCDVRFGTRTLSVFAAPAGATDDPTEFLLERTRQLETALASRIVIEQAKGILAERHGVDVEVAFERLRRAARSAQRNIHEVAADVVAGRSDPTV